MKEGAGEVGKGHRTWHVPWAPQRGDPAQTLCNLSKLTVNRNNWRVVVKIKFYGYSLFKVA